MDDIEERPSKIRKLDTVSNGETPTIKPSEPSSESLKTVQDPSNDPSQEEELLKLQLQSTADFSNDTPNASEDGPKLSKSQLKKQRKKAEWEAGKDDRRLKRREKHKEKQARKAAGKAEQAAEGGSTAPDTTKKQVYRRPIQVPVSFILDCDFNELMNEKEIISLSAQLTRCYSDNKSAAYRAHYAISSWGGSLQERFDGPLTKNHLGWKGVKFIPEDFVGAAGQMNEIMRAKQGGKLVGALKGKEVERKEGNGEVKVPKQEDVQPTTTNGDAAAAMSRLYAQQSGESQPEAIPTQAAPVENAPNSKPTAESEPATLIDSSPPLPPPSIVYLSSDSPHTLTSLSPYTSYIIGGIVDKNRHKGICYKRAQELGIPTAKLPIGEYMTIQSRTVLTVNHVFEIMLKWMELGDWGEAFVKVIPKRKEAKLRAGKGGVKDEDKAMEEEEEEDYDDERSEKSGRADGGVELQEDDTFEAGQR